MPHSETDEYGRAIARAFSTVGLTSADLVRLDQHRDSRIILGGAYRTMRRMLDDRDRRNRLREAGEETARFRAIFAERRRVMVDGLRRIGLGVGFEPTGAFYVLANARAYTQDSTRFAGTILEEANVAVTPGAAFGRNAEGYLRFSYASSIERIEEGLRRIERFLSARR